MSWTTMQFEELYAEPSRNGVYKSKEFQGTGIPIVKMNEIFENWRIHAGDFELDRFQLSSNEQQRFHLEIDDLIFARTSVVPDGVGKCSLICTIESDLAFESNLIRVRLDKIKVNPVYIFYFFQSPVGRGRVLAISNGVSVRTIRGSDLKGIKVDLPERKTQELIVSILSTYDDLIENNRRRIELLEKAARLLYKEWFVQLHFPGHEHVKIVGGVPEGWGKKLLGEVVDIKKGKNITKEIAIEGDVPVVAGGLTPAYFHNTANTIGPVITVSASGANAGYVNLYYEDIWASDCSYISRTSTEFIFYYYLVLISNQKEIFGFQKGAAQPHVYPKDLMRLTLLVPTQAIIRMFEQTISKNFLLIDVLRKQNKLLVKARDLLLPKLMNGEVVV